MRCRMATQLHGNSFGFVHPKQGIGLLVWICGQPSSTEGITSMVSVILVGDHYHCYFFLIWDSVKVLALKLQSRELGCKEVKVMEEAVGIQKREGG